MVSRYELHGLSVLLFLLVLGRGVVGRATGMDGTRVWTGVFLPGDNQDMDS
jgi:hypothetical protein